MLVLRSALFNALFYLTTLVQMIVYTPFYFLAPRKKAWAVPKTWARVNSWLLKVTCGADYRIEGLENLPDGPYIVAPKHQSAWDTFVFLPYIADPVMILKRELMWIPIFGQYVGRMKMIAIRRGSREEARRQVAEGTRKAADDGRQILIYPEGTRRPPGAPPAYKQGVAMIYEATGLPVVPIAHNDGLFWPRRKFLRYPGIMTIRILPPIEPGLPRNVMFERLVQETEAACDELLVAAANAPNPPPLPPTAVTRLRELGADLSGQA